jgi:Glyoxalase-like domain
VQPCNCGAANIRRYRAIPGRVRRTATVLMPPGGTGTPIALQLSQTPPQDHPRLHLDLHVASAAEEEAEAVSLVSLGARRVDWDSYPEDADFIVLEDPDGNRFWIVDLSHDHT